MAHTAEFRRAKRAKQIEENAKFVDAWVAYQKKKKAEWRMEDMVYYYEDSQNPYPGEGLNNFLGREHHAQTYWHQFNDRKKLRRKETDAKYAELEAIKDKRIKEWREYYLLAWGPPTFKITLHMNQHF